MQHLRHWPTAIALAATVAFAGTLPATAQEKVLIVAQPGETGLDNLDPRVHISTNHQFAQIAIFEPLVRSRGSEFEPAAAESWEISRDGMTYTFHLRDAKWSDGVARVGRGLRASPSSACSNRRSASAIYDDILNGAALRGGTSSPRSSGSRRRTTKDGRLHARAPAPYFLGLPRLALRRAGSRRPGGKVRRCLRSIGGQPCRRTALHPDGVEKREQGRPEEESGLLEHRQSISTRCAGSWCPTPPPSGTSSTMGTSTLHAGPRGRGAAYGDRASCAYTAAAVHAASAQPARPERSSQGEASLRSQLHEGDLLRLRPPRLRRQRAKGGNAIPATVQTPAGTAVSGIKAGRPGAMSARTSANTTPRRPTRRNRRTISTRH